MRLVERSAWLVAASMLTVAGERAVAQSESASAPASAALRGRVIDARTTQPIPSVTVVLTTRGDTAGRARTDSAGAFVVTAPAGHVVVHFVRLGYRADSTTAEVSAALGPLRVAMVPVGGETITSLGPTKVVASTGTTAFDRRAARHIGGVFITEDDIAKRGASSTSDLFRGLVGVTVRDSESIRQLVSNRGQQTAFPMTPPPSVNRSATSPSPSRGSPTAPATDDGAKPRSSQTRACVLRVGVDGHLMDPSFSIDDVPVISIHGIEAYLGAATIPIELSSVQHDAPCGIVMIWTRDRGPRGP